MFSNNINNNKTIIMEDYLTRFFELLFESRTQHLIIELLLVIWVIWLVSMKNAKNYPKLTESEKDAIIRDFEPEPLVTEVSSSHFALKPRVVCGKANKFINVDGIQCLNFATHNYLGFIGNKKIEKKAVEAIVKYGVGTCGPPLFCGCTECHLDLEKQLADFMGVEDAVLYSCAFPTISSAIAAYCKKGDIIFVDEKVNFSIQKGLDASRSLIRYFKHNDVKDLEKILEETRQEDLRNIKKAQRSRRFLIIEGIYANTGEICPLPELVRQCKTFKLRLFIDESISFSVLGKTGKGVTEYFGIPRYEVDLIMASLENSIASIGGFCVGSHFIIDHQRLSGSGHCFSASLPPLLVVAAMEALQMVREHPEMLENLKFLCQVMHDTLNGSMVIANYFDITGDRVSPLHLLIPKYNICSYRQALVNNVMESCFKDCKAISRASYLEADASGSSVSLRITTSVFLSEDDIFALVKTIESACKSQCYDK